MRGETIAKRYAEALFELGARQERLEEFGEAFQEVAQLLDELPQFRLFLETPRVESSEKRKVLREIFGGKVPPPVLNLVFLVVDKRRQRLLREMNREYQLLLDEHLERAHIEVSLARSLDDDALEGIRSRLSELLGREVVPHFRVRPELVGGIVFRSGDVVYDGSVRRRLQRMKRQLLAADVSTD